MIYETDLFSFSFVPNWYLQLDTLAELALPEPWRFRSGSYSEKNYDTPILERYIQSIFRKQVIDYNAATDKAEQDRIILMRNEYACFHTGLYTKRYKPIYACFGRNKKLDSLLKWCFRGFADENSALLRYISPLPEKPLYSMPLQGIHYVPDWPVRVNVEHILGDPANVARLPTELQSARNLPLLLETAVELARRKVVRLPRRCRPADLSAEAAIPPAAVFDGYGEAGPRHHPPAHGRVLHGIYLPDLGDGLSERTASGTAHSQMAAGLGGIKRLEGT